MHSPSIMLPALCGAVLCVSSAAFGAGLPLAPVNFALAPEPVAQALPAPVFEPVAVAEPVAEPGPAAASSSALDQARGGADTVSNDARLSGVVSNNSTTQLTTGANIIQSYSFANASGIPVVIQNSGANVLIQNATVINLQLK
jgi:hypothetical protein